MIPPDAKRAYLRRKYTSTKKMHFTEGWVEFKDKKVARSVAEMLNAQPIGGKKGTRWRDDVWTMKYLPKFKWRMLTEQIGMSCVCCCLHADKVMAAFIDMVSIYQLTKQRYMPRDYVSNCLSPDGNNKNT